MGSQRRDRSAFRCEAARRTRPGNIRVNDELGPAQRHAVAALCLYGQPFGFTRDDLDAFWAAYSAFCDSQNNDDTGRMDRLHSLGCRIEALLPPSPPEPET